MPCNDAEHHRDTRIQYVTRDNPKISAMLCAILGAMTEQERNRYIAKADWREAGVSGEELRLWYQRHLEADKRRRSEEALRRMEKINREKLRKSALSKLTPDERKELGLK